MKTITAPPMKGMEYPLIALRGLPSASRVDRTRKVIYGAAMIQMGKLNDSRKWLVDETTLSQVIELGGSNQKGLKARWTHPNMSRDGLGTFLGRWRNLRLSDDKQTVLADLHVSPMAMKGDSKGEYVLRMAEQEPDAFAISIYPGALDWDAMEALETEDGYQPMRILKLLAADVVDEAAATRGGFFGGLSIATAPEQATAALDALFADATADVIRARVGAFAETYIANRFGADPTKEDDMGAAALTREDFDSALATARAELQADFDAKLAALKPAEPPKVVESEGATDVAAALATERKRVVELTELHAASPIKDETALRRWIDKGLSVLEVKAEIGELAIKSGKLVADDDGKEDKSRSFEQLARAEYRQHSKLHASLGHASEDKYVEWRKPQLEAERAAA